MAFEQLFNGDSSSNKKDFTITDFDFLKSIHLKAEIGGSLVDSDDFSVAGKVVSFTTAPATGINNVKIYRDTPTDAAIHNYIAGGSLKSSDLNENQKQSLYAIEEGKAATLLTGTFTTGTKEDIHVISNSNWQIIDNKVTKAKMADNSVGTAEIETNAVTAAKIAANAVGASELADNAVDTAAIVADAVNGTKIADDSINSEHYVDGSIDTAHIADSQITLAKLASALVTSIQTTYSNPVGTVIWFAGSAPPKGYLKANGATITDSTTAISGNDSDGDAIGTVNTAALFAITGATLPDLRGEFIRGFDDGKGTDSGRGIRTSQTDEWKKHQHIFHGDDTSRAHWGSDGDGASDSFIRVSDDNMDFVSTTTGGGGGKYLTQSNSQGNSGGTETRPRNIALLACIKY